MTDKDERVSLLDADALAELERERTFLLRSLDDLDAEHAAGDMDHADYVALNDDYTRRAAETMRAIEQRRSAFADVSPRMSNAQRVLTIVAVVVIAAIAGVLLARASGFRAPRDSATGGIRASSITLLAEADTLTREGQWSEAIDVYDQVLQVSPANVEALTYRGWLTARLGEVGPGLVDITEAVSVDPAFPDARVFNAILLNDEGRYEEAAAQLQVLDGLDAPAEILALVDQSGLRAELAATRIRERFGGSDAIDLAAASIAVDDAAAAAATIYADDPVLGVQVYNAVLDQDADNLVALVGLGQRLGGDRALYEFSPEVAADGLGYLDRAVLLAPDSAEVRLYRAIARSVQDDLGGARDDLTQIDSADLPDQLVSVFEQLEGATG